MSAPRGWMERLSGGRTASTTEPSASRPEPGPDRPVRSNGPERTPLPGPGPRARPPVPDPEGPTLRVVLVSRDNMLAGALRSLIETPGGVRVLDWYSEELDSAIRHADVVIVDMPPNLHERTFAVIDGRFLGRTVVLLQEGEHAEALPAGPSRAVLYRPLQIGELWTAITGAATPVPAEPPQEAAGSPAPEPAKEGPEVDAAVGSPPAPAPEAGAEAADDHAAPGEADGAAAAVEVAGEGLPVAESGRLIGLSGRELEPVIGPGQVAPGMDEATFERLRRWGRQAPGKAGQPAGKRRTTAGRAEARRAKKARAEARRADRAAAGRAKAASAEARREQTRRERAARQEARQAARAEVARVRAARAESRTAAREASRQAKAAKAEARRVARAESRQARTDARQAAQERAREAKAAKAEARAAAEERARQAKAAEAVARAAAQREARQAKAAEAEAQAAAREEARRVKAAQAEAQAAAREEARKADAAARAVAQEEARQAKAAQAEARAAAQEEARQAKAAKAEARRVARAEARAARVARSEERRAASAAARQARAAEAAVRRAARTEARQAKAAETRARRAERAEARGVAREEARQARAVRAEARRLARAEAGQARAVRREEARRARAARAEVRRTARAEARQARAASTEARREQSRQARAARAAARTAAREEAARASAARAEARQAARAEEDRKRAAEAEVRRAQAQQAKAEQAKAREAASAEAARKQTEQAEARKVARAEAAQQRQARAEARKAARAEAGQARAAQAELRREARAEAAQQRRVQAEARRAQSREAKTARAQARETARAEAGRERAEQAEVRRVARAEAAQRRAAQAAARSVARAEARQERGVGAGVGLLALVVLVVAVVGLVAAGWRGGGGPESRAGEVAVVRAAGGSDGGLVVQDPRVGPIEPLYALGVGVVLRGAEAGTSLEGAIRDARVPNRYLLAAVVGLTVLLFLLLMRVGPGTGAAAGPGPAPPQRQGRDRLWRLGGAALAGLLVALDPVLVRSGRAATGTVLAVLLALATLALAWGVPARPTLRWLPLVAAGGGLALLVSPLALPVLAVPVVAELLEGRYQEAWRDMAALVLAVGLWLVLPVWVAGQELGAGQAGWLLGRPPGRGPVVASLADDRLTWLLVAGGLAAAILAWRHRSGARLDPEPDPPGDPPGPARALAWTMTTAAGAVGAVALGYPASQALPFAVPAAAVSLALAAGWAVAAVRGAAGVVPRWTGGVVPRWIGLGVAVALAGLLVAQGVDWGARYGGQADDGLGQLVATVGDQVPDCSAVNASGPDDRARLLAAGVTVTEFADGPAAHAAGVRYFVLTGGNAGGGPMTPSLAAWVRQHGTRMASHPSRTLSGVELWRVDAAPLDPVADSLPVADGLFSNVDGSACGGYRVVDSQAGTFHTAYRAAGGKMVLGRPLGSVWTSDGPALQAFDTMVLGSVPTASGPPAVRPIELPPLLAKLDVEAVADANIPLPSVRPPVTDRQVRTLLSDELIARAYLGTDPASASAEDFRRARDRFGRPLGVPQVMPDGAMRQPFERAVLELPADGGPARPAALGRLAVRLGLVPKQAMRLEPVPGLPAPAAETRLDPAPLLRLIGVGLVLLALTAGAGAVVARRSRTGGAR